MLFTEVNNTSDNGFLKYFKKSKPLDWKEKIIFNNCETE